MPEVQFLCLAKSWKRGGFCIAGKKIENNMVTNWFRPVSQHDEGGVSEVECRLANLRTPQILDFITCGVGDSCPQGAQCENHYIDGTAWTHNGRLNAPVAPYCDYPDSLWGTGYSSTNGTNDRVPEDIARLLPGSLNLISLEEATVKIQEEDFNGNSRLKARLSFIYKEYTYVLSLSDTVKSRQYEQKGAGEYSVNNCYVTVSLSVPFNGYCYKVAAGLIE
ncbi:hypothetical protein LF599_16830 [Pseudodesulfovibrio thermohalotolerans]|uniref:dual OB domain-containing protein n=1 Tax=Pseudodesulfovibrio thermohalotolerans TaxID=2880651 RepID=UPI002441D72A|nr:hypothetical protein [Pseudodesulfovibrio thermohalotolerans]WFS62303.1 hypothetical protein LF599_16830 [Pseudodesulfovibrio thermohalotolerans]